MTSKERKASPELRRRLAYNLRMFRMDRGWTQLQLAKYSGLTNGQISNMERRKVNASLAAIEALSIALGCWEADLIRPMPGERRE